jgi:hypothetical protein
MLHMQIWTARKAHGKIMSRSKGIENPAPDIEGADEEHITSYITSARRIFQIIGGIRTSPRLSSTMAWLYVIY